MKKAVLVLLLVVLLGSSLSVATGEAQRPQPGATQGGPTTGDEMMPLFDMRYFVGEWEIEWTPLDTPLLPGGKYTGTETIRHIENGRYFDVTVELEGPDGGLSGKGIMFFESGPFGSHLTKYVVYDAGFTLLQPGPVGGDLGGYYSQFWETPEPIHYNDAQFLIKGRSYYVSPAAYRVNQEISVDDEPFINFGVMWYTKVMEDGARKENGQASSDRHVGRSHRARLGPKRGDGRLGDQAEHPDRHHDVAGPVRAGR
ncbi:MAG: hypothetical protein DSY84_05570 [Candidatus Neomarinimicrobiota bacterium]|jgi:hypothetical protein|nr:MAG: hypothetical protein DSY84_05570 [Candidatus Neomarinimicrobiota bacterium]